MPYVNLKFSSSFYAGNAINQGDSIDVEIQFYHLLVCDISDAGIGTTQLKAQDGLIAHWTFDDVKDGKVKDISPNGHHATLEGKTKWIAKGAIGGALEFAGNGDYLQTPILDELKSPKNFTLSAWFQTNDTSEDEHHIIWVGEGGQNGWGGGSELHLSIRHFRHPNKLSFYFGSGGESSGSEINIVTKEDFKDTSK